VRGWDIAQPVPVVSQVEKKRERTCELFLSSVMENASAADGNSQPEKNNAFERWRRKFALMTGLGGTEAERLHDIEEFQARMCEKRKVYLMNYSLCTFFLLRVYLIVRFPGPAVVFMLKHLELSGCSVSSENILCAPCDYTRSGGFSPKTGSVILCSGKFFNKDHMESTLVHELVHMYDHCKFNVDWSDLRHHACSEVSA
jgi:inner membrane protease ATP23